MSSSIYDIPATRITGEAASLSEFKGKVLLLVNVASKCGLTPQYEGLENLYERLRGQGLVVAGFPANDFKGQEPGTNDEIQSFCTLNYGVKFPMFGKIQVTGAEKHPLYASLIAAQPTAKGDPADVRDRIVVAGDWPKTLTKKFRHRYRNRYDLPKCVLATRFLD